MPRVTQHKKSRAGKPYTCQTCRQEIEPGQTYYEWSFRYGGTHRIHTEHGHPRSSQLTQSKMATVYAAAEALEDWTVLPNCDANATPEMVEQAIQEIVSDAEGAIETAKDEAQGVIDEYQDAIDQMPASEAENQERIDAIEDWIQALEGAESELSSVDTTPEYDEADSEAGEQAVNDAYDEIAGIISTAASGFSY